MGTNEKSGQPVQKPEHRPDEHFAARRKILGGLAGAPVFLTFSPHAGAQAIESFARCVNNVLEEEGLPTPTTDLSQYYYSVDQNSEITTLYSDATDETCGTEVAMLSAVCLASFVAGGTLPTKVCTPPTPPAASSAAASTATSSITAPPVK